MQLVGLAFMVGGYAAAYKAAQMLKRPSGAKVGSYLYYLTGITTLGAPSGFGDQKAPRIGPAGAIGGSGGGAAKGTKARLGINPGGHGAPVPK